VLPYKEKLSVHLKSHEESVKEKYQNNSSVYEYNVNTRDSKMAARGRKQKVSLL
jgi:hypothetical protein